MRAISRLLRNRQPGTRKSIIAWAISALFANGEQGAWYDPSDLTTLYQDSAGTTPVTAVEQYVALVLDKRNTSYSVYFDGSGGKLTTASNPGLAFASGDFTVEAWVYPTTLSSYHTVIATRPNSVDSQTSWSVTVTGSGTPPGNGAVVFYSNGFTPSTASGNVVINQWTHVAVTRNGSTLRIFCNGVVLYTGADTKNYTDQVVTIGALASTTETLTGYVSNARIVKGAALYTANFTPPSSPLTAVAGTSLLTCGNAWSGNPSITQSGDVRADKLSPFATGTGNHAFQATSTKRPVLSARVNLLTKTEDFSDAVWVKQLASVVGGVTAPDGSSTSFTVTALAANGQIYQSTSTGKTKLTGYIRRRSGSGRVLMYDGVASIPLTVTSSWTAINFDLAVSSIYQWNLVIETSGDAVDIWHPDARVSNDGVNLPAYQRVNTAADYDTVGFPKGDKFDGIDDFQITSSGGGGSSAFFFCAAIRAGKVGATQTLFSDTGTNTGYRVRINASNQLEFSAGNGSSYTTVVTTATLAVGQRAVVTCWHDGTNLNAQINSGTVAQTAFATASAGTAQTTIGADNNAASSFFTGSVYESIYVKDDVLTAAQILSSQQYCATIGKITL